MTGLSQDVLRNQLEGEYWLEQRRRLLEAQPYNIRWGDFKALAEMSMTARYDSNVNLSEVDPQEDLILQPAGRVFSVMPLSDKNALTLDLSVSYLAFTQNPDLNRLLIEPGSVVSFDVFVDETRINFHDRFSYLDDPLETGPVSDASRFGGLYNTAGVSAHHQFNQVLVEGGYDYFIFSSSIDRFDYLNRGNHGVFLRTTAGVLPELELGIETSGGATTYREAILNDNQNISLGPVVFWRISEHLDWTVRGGIVRYFFDSTGVVPPQDDSNSFYVASDLHHDINEKFGSLLRFSRSFQQGVSSELLDLWRLSHEMEWGMVRRLPITTLIYVESGSESNAVREEEYNRIGALVRADRALSDHLVLRLQYDFTSKDSNLPDRDYVDHRLSISGVWRF